LPDGLAENNDFEPQIVDDHLSRKVEIKVKEYLSNK
jgi:hypothetical protein